MSVKREANLTVVNFTPHDITYFYKNEGDEDERSHTFRPSSDPIRLAEDHGPIKKRRLTRQTVEFQTTKPIKYTGLVDMPKKSDYTIIVSDKVAEWIVAHPEEWDGLVLVPDTGPEYGIRDKNGKPIGTKNFIVYKEAKE